MCMNDKVMNEPRVSLMNHICVGCIILFLEEYGDKPLFFFKFSLIIGVFNGYYFCEMKISQKKNSIKPPYFTDVPYRQSEVMWKMIKLKGI